MRLLSFLLTLYASAASPVEAVSSLRVLLADALALDALLSDGLVIVGHKTIGNCSPIVFPYPPFSTGHPPTEGTLFQPDDFASSIFSTVPLRTEKIVLVLYY